MKQKKILLAFLILNLLACNTAVLAKEPTKQEYTKLMSNTQLKGSVADYQTQYLNKEWWESFNDEYLTSYIMQAAQANHDIKMSTLNVYETQAKVREALGKEFPLVTIGGDFLRQKTSDNVAMGNFKLPEYTQNSFLFPINASYELDLWRKNRDKTLSVKKELEIAKHEEKAAYISLTSAVATAYFNTIRADKLIKLQKELVAIKAELLKLTKVKNEYGLCSELDTIQAEKELKKAEIELSEYQKQQNLFLNQLAVLTGQGVDNTQSLKRASIEQLSLLNNLPESIPSNIILNRPDILKSEAQLQKTMLDVKLARKDFLPDISITGQFGFNANTFSKVFEWDSYIASVGVGFMEKLFTGGQRHARLKAKKYHYDLMLENYQKTILQSFQEVNDTLFSLKTANKKQADTASRLNLEKRTFELMNIKYNEGAMSYMEKLKSREKLVSMEQEQINTKTDCFINYLSLYKSIGGEKINK